METAPRPGWLKQILTADRASSIYDAVRVAFAIAFVTGVGLQIYSVVWRDAVFDIEKFGIGFGLMIGGAGGAMALRKDQEK